MFSKNNMAINVILCMEKISIISENILLCFYNKYYIVKGLNDTTSKMNRKYFEPILTEIMNCKGKKARL